MTDPSKTPGFVNPYLGARKSGNFHSIQTEVFKDKFILKRIRPDSGTVDITINLLYKKLYDELTRRGITDYTRVSDFEHFVVNSVLVLPGESTGSPLPTANASPNGGGVEGRSGPNPPAPGQQRSVPPSGTKKRGTGHRDEVKPV